MSRYPRTRVAELLTEILEVVIRREDCNKRTCIYCHDKELGLSDTAKV
jgi:hypothetical protein